MSYYSNFKLKEKDVNERRCKRGVIFFSKEYINKHTSFVILYIYTILYMIIILKYQPYSMYLPIFSRLLPRCSL